MYDCHSFGNFVVVDQKPQTKARGFFSWSFAGYESRLRKSDRIQIFDCSKNPVFFLHSWFLFSPSFVDMETENVQQPSLADDQEAPEAMTAGEEKSSEEICEEGPPSSPISCSDTQANNPTSVVDSDNYGRPAAVQPASQDQFSSTGMAVSQQEEVEEYAVMDSDSEVPDHPSSHEPGEMAEPSSSPVRAVEQEAASPCEEDIPDDRDVAQTTSPIYEEVAEFSLDEEELQDTAEDDDEVQQTSLDEEVPQDDVVPSNDEETPQTPLDQKVHSPSMDEEVGAGSVDADVSPASVEGVPSPYGDDDQPRSPGEKQISVDEKTCLSSVDEEKPSATAADEFFQPAIEEAIPTASVEDDEPQPSCVDEEMATAEPEAQSPSASQTTPAYSAKKWVLLLG